MTGDSRLILCVLFASLVCVSCASNQPEQTGLPNNTFSSISLISQSDLIEIVNPGTKTDRAKEGFSKGAAAGGVGGMAAGAVCGPYWGLCAGGFGLIGWFTGGVTGALYGFTGISEQDADALREKMELVEHEWDFQASLVENVKQRLPKAMLSEPDVSEVHAVLVLESVEFENHNQDIVLKSRARLTFTLNKSVTEPAIGSKIFSGNSHAAEIDDWLEYEPEAIQKAMEESLLVISEKVTAALTERWAQ